jgi:hypothetical protein
MEKNSPFFLGENRLVGFALCVVFRGVDMEHTETRDSRFLYKLTFESNGKTLTLPGYQLTNSFNWKRQHRYFVQDHTFLWKYQFDFTRLGNKLFHAHNFTFKIHDFPSNFRSTETVKECGICPLYTIQSDEMVWDFYKMALKVDEKKQKKMDPWLLVTGFLNLLPFVYNNVYNHLSK